MLEKCSIICNTDKSKSFFVSDKKRRCFYGQIQKNHDCRHCGLGRYLRRRCRDTDRVAHEPVSPRRRAGRNRSVPTETTPVVTEPVVEPDDFADPEPTTQAPTTQAPTTKAPTTKAPTTKAPTTTQAPTTRTTTQAPTTRATTQATTTRPTTTQATTANRNGPFALIVNSDNGGYEVSGGGRYSSGEFVKVSMTPRVGYKFVRWESSDTKVLPNSTSQTYVFQMPTSGVSLHAVTQAQTLLTVNKGKGISSVITRPAIRSRSPRS